MHKNVGACAVGSPIESVGETDVERPRMPADQMQLLEADRVKALGRLAIALAFFRPQFARPIADGVDAKELEALRL